MPNFDEEVTISDQSKIKTVLAAGHLGLFRDQLGQGMFGGLADGAHLQPGQMFISDGGKIRVWIEGDRSNLWLGGGGQGGDVVLFPASAPGAMNTKVAQSSILLAGNEGVIVLRSVGNGEVVARIDGQRGNVWLGGNGIDGDIVLHPSTVGNNADEEMSSIHLSAEESRITLRSGGKPSIVIDGKAGDIVLPNADCAEDFEVNDPAVEPGSVLVVGDDGRLRMTDRPYDRRVAGVVSGAGGLRPGVVLGRRADATGTVPIGLAGRVYCKVDATSRPIETGDLLTTATTRGHAMAAEDPARAFGAVLGKALAPLSGGAAMIPVLVSLQ